MDCPELNPKPYQLGCVCWIPLGLLAARNLLYSCGLTSVVRTLLDILQRKLAKIGFATALSSASNDLVGFQIGSIGDKVLDTIVGGICGSGDDLFIRSMPLLVS